jgi:hypothetical protein
MGGVPVIGSLFGGGQKADAPDNSALLAQNKAAQDAASAQKKKDDDAAALQKRLRLSGNFGRRSLFTNGEEGYGAGGSATLGGT